MSYAVVRLSGLSVEHPLPPTAAPKDSESSAAGAVPEPTSSRSGLGGCPLRILVNSPDTGNRCVPVLSLSLSFSLLSLSVSLSVSLCLRVRGWGLCSSRRALGVPCGGAETQWALAAAARSLMQCATALDLLPDADSGSGAAAVAFLFGGGFD